MAENGTNGTNGGYVGTRAIRPDGVDKVTGRARFGADFNLPGQLIGRVLRSPHPPARISSIDTSKAEALPGVKAVITRDDFPDQPSEFIPAGEMMMNYKDVVRNVMAREKALYEGHAVAAVAATSAIIARKALKLIDVTYEVLPHVIDVVEAMKPGAPVLHDDLYTVGAEPKPDQPSSKAKRPVKMAMSREEVFKASGPTSGATVKVKMGATKDGKFVAGFAELKYQAGAFQGSPVQPGVFCAYAPYDIENVKVIGYDVVSNRPKVAAYRAPGAPISEYAVESVVDEIAKKLDIDPIDLRMQNAAREGTKAAYGPKFGPIGMEETLNAVKKTEHWNAPLRKWQGRGVASGFWFNIGGETSVSLTVNEDGTISLMAGTPDIGGLRASLAAVAADELGVPYDKVAGKTGGPSGGVGRINAQGAGPSFGTHLVDLEVDPETGRVTVLRYTVAQDAGRALHPAYVEGQFQGGAVQGIGWALNEEYVYGTDGKLQNAGFLDYRMPVASDVPMIDAILVEVANPKHPLGVRGVGETPIVPPLGAIANAMEAATGIRFTELPMSPPKVLKALREKGVTAT